MEIHRSPIDHPGVWHGGTFDGKESITFTFGKAELHAIDEAVAQLRARSLTLEQIERGDFNQPILTEFMGRFHREVMHGRGLAILRGFPTDRYDEDTLGKIFWGIGRHIGTPVSQSVMGERLGHIVNVSDVDSTARAYRNKNELFPHTDLMDVVTFMCLQPAKAGGVNRFVSALAVHNEVQALHPELLETMYRGFHYHRFGEHTPGSPPITPHRVPLFSYRDGHLSCRYIPKFIEIAAEESGQPLSSLEQEALNAFNAISRRPDMRVEVTLAAGEAVFINNFTALHARTAFEEHEDRAFKRHMMRLWLMPDTPRPVVPEIALHEGELTGVGITPQPGKQPSFHAYKVN